MDESTTDDPMVAALLRERDGYMTRGLVDRVAEVNEQLALRGYTDPQPSAKAAAPREPGPKNKTTR